MRSLRTKIGATYLLLVAVTVGVASFATRSFTQFRADVGQLLGGDYKTVLSAEGMAKALERQENARLAWQTGNLDGARYDFEREKDQFRAWHNEAAGGGVVGAPLLDSVAAAHDGYVAASERLYRALAAAETTRARPFEQEAATLAADVRTLTFRVLDRTWVHMDDARTRVDSDAQRRSGLVLSTALGALGLSLLLAAYLARTILGPIERLTDSVVALRQGRLRQTVPVRSNDELAELGREFNRMTERLTAYEALNVQQLVAEKRKSETLVATMPSPVVVTDEDGRVLLLNEAARDLLGVPEGAWADRPLADVVPDPALRRVLAAPLPDAAGGDGAALPDDPVAEAGEVVALETDGEPHHYRVRRRVVESGAGRLTVALLEDVTHFTRLDRLKTDFLAAVSHELRTPLMSMGMAVDLLRQDGGALSDLQRDLLASVKDDNERLGRLVQGLLALARVESGTYRPPHEPVRLAAVVEEGLGSLRLPFLEQGVALDVDVPDGLPLVYGDAHHLGWVVTNLAGNALRYTPEGGRVTVRADADADGVHLHVADTGTGVPADALDAIFGAFVQVKAPGQATPGSLGLGLALARRVVEAHGGRIWAESVQAGADGGPSGSTFHVALPLDPDRVAAPAAARV